MKNDIPGWSINIDEVSQCIFKVTLTDDSGRKVEAVGVNKYETICKVKDDVFEIEKEVSKNWSRFLYDFFIQKMNKSLFVAESYDEKDFGSWFIQLKDRRFVYDGRDYLFREEKLINEIWIERRCLLKEDISYSQLIEIIKLNLQ